MAFIGQWWANKMGTQRPTRRMWWGYTDIGRIQIPPNPKYLILTDRTTGKLWWVTFNAPSGTGDGFGYVALNDKFPCNSNIDGASNGPRTIPLPKVYNNCVIYDAYDEPVLGMADSQTIVRLIVDNGFLGASVETLKNQAGSAPLAPPVVLIQDTGITGFNAEQVTIILDILTATNGTYLVWKPSTLTQTSNPSPVQTYD
jgi:hypothetical protein